jgi:hypothetical protein
MATTTNTVCRVAELAAVHRDRESRKNVWLLRRRPAGDDGCDRGRTGDLCRVVGAGRHQR